MDLDDLRNHNARGATIQDTAESLWRSQAEVLGKSSEIGVRRGRIGISRGKFPPFFGESGRGLSSEPVSIPFHAAGRRYAASMCVWGRRHSGSVRAYLGRTLSATDRMLG